MKTAAIIGAGSMLGSQLTAELRARGVETLSVGRSAKDDIVFDLERGCAGTFTASADVVFHCASSFGDDSDAGIGQNYATNTASALGVAELVRRLEAKALIYAGSIWSDAALNPERFNSYGLTKALAEQMLSWLLQKQGARFCSLRLSQLYDTDGRCCTHQPWFGRVVAYASRGADIRMPASLGHQNFLHVRDAAGLMIGAAGGALSGINAAVHPERLSYSAIAEIAYEVFDRGGAIKIATEKAPFRAANFPDGAETLSRLDMDPLIAMRDGIAMIKSAGTAEAFGPMDVK
ncbi:NAD(P)-dependent oxidoreductase [Ensifer sp. ENS09]|uniref:NAD-dependent epimerase/dehydratase family protein n=1 Tax=Ensifer sp. ENS09 TaxID=2769263 RepID=UPI00177AA0FB|nr:NAD(P)-dependent oxidoreductase [Ensifer sp. ENS09]MBD9648169.1 NAD(P)-dependent oxidoreductase [Ensifer sp. ENS09]